MRKLIFFFLIMFCSLILRAQDYSPVTDIAKFKEQFGVTARNIQTIKSDFTQEKNLSMLSEKITSKGKFWFKKDNLLRMEYTKPFDYLMILNKDNVYVKDGKNETKVSTRSNKIFQQINKITVDCVQGTVLSNPDFKTRILENKNNYLVELSPVSKGLKEFFKTIKVYIDRKDYAVNTIEMDENSGDDTVLHFSNRELNTAIPDALFTIK